MRIAFFTVIVIVNMLVYLDLRFIHPAQMDGIAAHLLVTDSADLQIKQQIANSILNAAGRLDARSSYICLVSTLIAVCGLVYEIVRLSKKLP